MNFNKIGFSITLIISTLYGCTKGDKNVSVVLKSVDVLYSVFNDSLRIKFPGKNKNTIIVVPQGEIKSEKFRSNISLLLTLVLKNNYDTDVIVQLNDLNMHHVSFEPTLFLKNKTLKFYNYPFSLTRLPIKNSFFLKPQESKVINLESPIFYYSESFDAVKLDSIIKFIKKNNFNIEIGNENTSVKFKLDSGKMIILSEPNISFPIYPKNGIGF